MVPKNIFPFMDFTPITSALSPYEHTASVNMVSKSPAGLGSQLCAVYFAAVLIWGVPEMGVPPNHPLKWDFPL